MSPRCTTRPIDGSALISAMSVGKPAIWAAPYGTSPMMASVEASPLCADAGAAPMSAAAVRNERSRRMCGDPRCASAPQLYPAGCRPPKSRAAALLLFFDRDPEGLERLGPELVQVGAQHGQPRS